MKSIKPEIELCKVTWEVSSVCSNKCWYCDPRHWDGKSWPDVEKALSFITELSEKNSLVYLIMSGGEPTLWNSLPSFLSRLPRNVIVNLLTNGMRESAWWDGLDMSRIRTVSMSYHPGYSDPEKVVERCCYIKSKGVVVDVNLLVDFSYRDAILKLYKDLKNNDILVQGRPIDWHGITYTLEERKWIDSLRHVPSDHVRFPGWVYYTEDDTQVLVHPKTFQVEQTNQFQGWLCEAGSTCFHVTTTGDIYAGTCQVQHLGNLDQYTVLTEPITCPLHSCNCGMDIRTPKWEIK